MRCRSGGWRASYFIDNPASGNVLRKLGFRDLGRTRMQQTLARREPVEAVLVECDLDARPTVAPDLDPDANMPIAA